MACIRERRGKWTLDYRDVFGRRRWQTFPLTSEGLRLAEIEKGKILAQSGKRGATVYDPDTTLDEYAPTWLRLVSVRLKPSTVQNYDTGLRLHLLPLLGRFRLRDLSRPRLKLWVADVRTRLAPGSVSVLIGLLNSVLASAVEDGLLDANPARGLGKIMGITASRDDEDVRAFTASQLEAFRAAAPYVAPKFALAFLVYGYTGLRLAEGMGLQVDDVDLDGRAMRVARQIMWNGGGLVKPPKSRRSLRTVDLSDSLRDVIRETLERRSFTARRSPWLLFPEWGSPPIKTARQDAAKLQAAFKRIAKAAGLPAHHSIHSLRHTYASLLLQSGESIQYVCDQLGHSSIKITHDLYGRWLPMRAVMGGPNILTGRAQDATTRDAKG